MENYEYKKLTYAITFNYVGIIIILYLIDKIYFIIHFISISYIYFVCLCQLLISMNVIFIL